MSTRCRAIASLVLTLSLAAGSGWADSVQVDALRVNVRKEPSTASAIVAAVSRGEVLEVLDRAGDWYRIKTRSGAEGYVSARLLRAAAPAAGTSTPTPRAAAPETPARAAAPTAVPSPWTGERPVIAHQDVGCVVAGEFPRLEACFTPAESVGKAQVQFRADEKGPWYYVDMKESGGCRSALLPKPKKDVGTFHYFIEVVDRSFTAVQKPETAPSQSYAPRVVANRRECGQGMMMATGTPTGTVVMGVARDAGGHVLQAAAAHSAELQASISGFSADGVSMASTGTAPGSAGAGSSTAQSTGGLGTKTLVIAGGVVGAGALVALAAGGGGGSGSSGSGTSGGGGSGAAAPGGGATTGALTGRWAGTAANGGGLTGVATVEGITCTSVWDITTDLVHSGSTLSGTGTSVPRGVTCSVALPPGLDALLSGQSGSGTLSGTANAGALSFQAGMLAFTGTYTTSRIDAVASIVIEGITINWTWRQTKQ